MSEIEARLETLEERIRSLERLNEGETMVESMKRVGLPTDQARLFAAFEGAYRVIIEIQGKQEVRIAALEQTVAALEKLTQPLKVYR